MENNHLKKGICTHCKIVSNKLLLFDPHHILDNCHGHHGPCPCKNILSSVNFLRLNTKSAYILLFRDIFECFGGVFSQFSGVKFGIWKYCMCKRNDKYQVWREHVLLLLFHCFSFASKYCRRTMEVCKQRMHFTFLLQLPSYLGSSYFAVNFIKFKCICICYKLHDFYLSNFKLE